MRELFIPLPGGFPVTISVWTTGVVLCQALASVSVGSWGNAWTPLSGVIVTQVRDFITRFYALFFVPIKLYNRS
jgi:hypothetical protein